MRLKTWHLVAMLAALVVVILVWMVDVAGSHPKRDEYVKRYVARYLNQADHLPTTLAIYPKDERADLRKVANRRWERIDRKWDAMLAEAEELGEEVDAAVVGDSAAISVAPPVPSSSGSADWYAINQCEASGQWNNVPGYYEGGLQFAPSTWDAYKPSGYPESAETASVAQQIAVAEIVLDAQGPGAWPTCFSW